MWGYITATNFSSCPSGVPSLYVRVYRTRGTPEEQKRRSLIICEGISGHSRLVCRGLWFPHYMWGYITGETKRQSRRGVPSLYVRVYRSDRGGTTRKTPSLIICEGISSTRQIAEEFKVFPHYMWGYIGYPHFWGLMNIVPSLYVRIYQHNQQQIDGSSRSLIICEGISPRQGERQSGALFPHYIWGYIEIGNGILQASKNINVVDDSIPQIA